MVSVIINFADSMTRAGVEQLYESSRFAGDPTLLFEEINPKEWKVTLHPRHTARIQPDEFKRFLRLRLHCTAM